MKSLNKVELIEFFHDNYEVRKGDLSTFKKIAEVAEELHYDLIKNGVDNFTLQEKSAILDTTKPLKMIRDIPSTSPFDSYKGLSRKCIVNDPVWFYLANQEDNKVISITFLAESLGEDVNTILWRLDRMSNDGYLIETKDNLEFHFYPMNKPVADRCIGNYYQGNVAR